ncbi:MAG: hypothetical protein C4520_17900 [Candidatus Abyssobacteria bacterium SURF_5]|uniref:Uncharacterized protein n=1 Tax=Abyssobacteria bacterium (strain SURF_5) TaxID=2093360 RepID=A0A3A4NEC8_ABYX5|nr:MAG: hypothetical protein C4520_17900 [Candidatus Abyssubacteria bacterium SURF_5]
MKFLKWLFGPNQEGKNEKYEKMPNFKKIFASLPDIVKATAIPPDDSKRENDATAQERDAARCVAEDEARAAVSKDKVQDVYIRIQTAMNRNKEIIWLLQTDREISHKSLNDLLQTYRKMKDSDSYKGMSVNYGSAGELHEISSLNERDLEGLAQKLEGKKNAGAKAFATER